jgi:putative phosphoribosyl transferase
MPTRAQPFRNRTDAGRQLAAALLEYGGRDDVVVLGLPRGGVPVAFEIAQSLGAPLDVFVVRKLALPGQEEAAIGAIATGGVRVLDTRLLETLRLSPELMDRIEARERRELERREQVSRAGRPAPELANKTVIVVDDGLATGATMLAAVLALREHRPAQMVVAVPVADSDVCRALEREAGEVRCLMTPKPLRAVGVWYDDFGQISDDVVCELLEQARLRLGDHQHSRHHGERHAADGEDRDGT